MWNPTFKILEKGIRHSTKVLRSQNSERSDVRQRGVSDLPVNIRTTDCHQAIASFKNCGRQGLLEIKKQIIENQWNSREKEKSFVKKFDRELLKILLEKNFHNEKEKIIENFGKSQDFSWSAELRRQLCEVFRFTEFRPFQLEVMNSSLQGNDVIVVMETAGGKSLCFQLPALISTGFTLVICPLISLMEDQVFNLNKLGVSARMLTAETSQEENFEIMNLIEESSSELKLLYVTPEKLTKNKKFLKQLSASYKRGYLSRIVIDEFHCISEWGNDFRPGYKALSLLKENFPKTPIMCLSATSTNKIIEDTKLILNIPKCLVFKSTNLRLNLFYDVRTKPMNHKDVVYDITKIIKHHFQNQSGIIYCVSRRNCTDVNNYLIKQGIKSEIYHAMLSPQDKTQIYQDWKNNKIQVIVATVAFGMGIDKPDVRFVIHHSISKSMNNYYQESGRVGRDGKPSLCLLYFGFNDVFKRLNSTQSKPGPEFMEILDYCLPTNRCKHSNKVFNLDLNIKEKCKEMCNACTGLQEIRNHDVTEVCHALLDVVRSSEKHVTAIQLVTMTTSNRGQTKNKKIFQKFTKTQIQMIILNMIKSNILRIKLTNGKSRKYSYVIPGCDVINRQLTFLLPEAVEVCSDDVYEQKFKRGQPKSSKIKSRDHTFVSSDVIKTCTSVLPRDPVTSSHSPNLKLSLVSMTSQISPTN